MFAKYATQVTHSNAHCELLILVKIKFSAITQTNKYITDKKKIKIKTFM